MNTKMNLKKIYDFRSSLRYRPWGILVGVSVSYPTRAVAQLLGESRAYGLNKLLNKPAYDVTVMDDLALGGASLLSAHYIPVYLKQSCWHKFVDAAKTDRIKEVTYQICVCVYNNCWCDELTVFSKRDKLEIGGVNPLKTY